jgi:TonB-linked SusC/RagA family outer membrane protein
MREKNQKKRMTILQHVLLLVLIVYSSAISFAQTGQIQTIHGVVVDKAGVTIPGVSIMVKQASGVGTISDLDGKFSIKVSEKATLVFTYIGYEPRELIVGSNENLKIVLQENSRDLDEVVVIAYGTQKKVTITGAVSSVGSAELMKTPVASLGLALAGKVTGLSSIQYSGAPGADDPALYVRGMGSLSASGSAPLVLVDGVERSFTQIDPNEVADISILKDASATAVFGVRGANGVILVTTKRGTVGKTKISATASWGAQVPTMLMDFTNSYDFASFYNESQKNDGVLPSQLKFQPEVLDAFKNHTLPTVYPNVKWLDYMLQDYAPQSQYNVNLSGGTEKVKYFVSAGTLHQGGLFKTFNTDKNNNFNYDRFNYRANIDVDLTKTTSMAINLGGRVENRNFPANGESDIFRYLQASTPFGGAGIVDDKWIITNPANIVDPGRDGLDKVYGRGYSASSKNVLNFDLQLSQDLSFITKGLNIKIKGSYNNSFDHIKNRGASIPSYMAVKQTDGSFQLQKNGDPSLLSFSESSRSARDWYSELSVNYQHKFKGHNFSALLLYNQVKRFYPGTYSDIPTGYVGLVGRVTYDYNTRYLLDLNMGYNGSENFAPGKRYGFFPSTSVGWVVSNEKFLQEQSVLSYLKIRGSIGLVGNDKMGSYRFLYLPDVYGISNSGYYFGTNLTTSYPSAYEGSLGNPNVTWEKSLKEDAGVDVHLFKDKLKVNLDLFREHRTDILITSNNTPFVNGKTAPPINFGIVDNKGYEISVKWEDKLSKNFRYFINPNISYSKNKVIEKDEVKPNQPYLSETGKSVGQMFGYEFYGFYNGTETEDAYKSTYGVDAFPTQIIPGGLKPGDAVYVDLDGNGKITADDRHAIGFPEFPAYTFGLNIGCTVYGVDFSMLWGGSKDVSRKLDRLFRPAMTAQHNESLLQWSFDNRWTPETASTATLPRASFSSEGNNTVDSRLWIVDASYIRLRNIELGYSFQPQLLKKLHLGSLRVYFNAYNLLTFTKNFPGGDPEQVRDELDNMKYPNTKVMNVGMNIGF